MQKIEELYLKYKEVINYLIFGVLTTLVNFVGLFLVFIIALTICNLLIIMVIIHLNI